MGLWGRTVLVVKFHLISRSSGTTVLNLLLNAGEVPRWSLWSLAAPNVKHNPCPKSALEFDRCPVRDTVSHLYLEKAHVPASASCWTELEAWVMEASGDERHSLIF